MVVLAAAFFGIGATARAEPTLRYNFDYVCNQERVVVGHCRHDSDTRDMPPTTPEDDYCQVYYPDRPKGGGLEAMGVVLRGELIKSLEACGAFGATGGTPGGNAKVGATSAAAGPAQASAGPPPGGPAPVAPGGRPPTAAMPIGPAMCPLLRRLEALAHEDFRSIDTGPDRSVKEPERVHRTSMPIPGTRYCEINHYPGEPIYYSCTWPQSKQAEDQWWSMVKALQECTGGTLDTSVFDESGGVLDMTVNLRRVQYHTNVVSDSLVLDVQLAKP
jgi:hypothetical protein